MSIEEIFDLIRKKLGNYIKQSDLERKEFEYISNFLKKSNNNLYEKHFEEKKAINEELKNKYICEYIKAAEDYEGNEKAYSLISSYFGKNKIQRKVTNFSTLFVVLNIINKDVDFVINTEIFAKIFGMAIYNNNRIYEKSPKEKNKDLNNSDRSIRKETQAVLSLKPYFSSDGSILANDDETKFINSLFDLFALYFDFSFSDLLKDEFDYSMLLLLKLMKNQLSVANSNKTYIEDDLGVVGKKVISKSERRELMEQQRLNEQELATYYDGEKILRACNSLEEFMTLVNSCNLSGENRTRIITKMQTFLNNNSSLKKISFLTLEEQEIYKIAQERQFGNIQVKELVGEIELFLEMNNENISKEDKECIENEVKEKLSRLKWILSNATLKLSFK